MPLKVRVRAGSRTGVSRMTVLLPAGAEVGHEVPRAPPVDLDLCVLEVAVEVVFGGPEVPLVHVLGVDLDGDAQPALPAPQIAQIAAQQDLEIEVAQAVAQE